MALRVGELYATLKLNDKDFQQALGRSKSGFDGLKGAIGKGVQATANAFAGTTLAVAGLGLAALKVGLDYNRMQQSSRAALSTLLGGAEAANAQMDKLDNFARNSPFAKQVFIQAQQQLLGFGVAAEDVIPTLDAVQNAVAAVGGNNDQVSSVTYALAQMQGQGKLTGETLNQLGQYGIDAATILGKEMGKSGEEIRKLASKPGGIPVDQVFKPLTDGLMKRFGGATDNIKQQFDGAADRIKGAFRDIGSALAAPFIDPNGGGRAVEWTNKVADAMRALETKIKPLVTLLIDRFNPQLEKITPILDKVRGSINAWDISKVNGQLDAMSKYAPVIGTVAAGLFAMGTNVPVLASLGLTLNPVVAAIAALAITSPEVRDAFTRILTSVQPLLPIMAELGIQLADVLVHAIETLAPAVGDLAVGLGEAGVSLVSGLTPALAGLLTAATPLIDVVASLATFVGGLPTPLLAAGLAMAALYGPVSNVTKLLVGGGVKIFSKFGEAMAEAGLSAEITGRSITPMGAAMEVAAGGAKTLGAALKAAFISSGIGLAVIAVTTAIGYFVGKNADARQSSEELRGTLDETTGAITKQTEEMMFAAMEMERGFFNSRAGQSMMDDAEALGLSLELVKDAMLGNVDAMEQVEDARRAHMEAGFADRQAQDEARDMWDHVTNGIRDNAGSLEEAQEKQRRFNEMAGLGTEAQQKAAAAARDNTDAILAQTEATKEAGDAALSEAEALLRKREADLQVKDSVEAYKKMQDEGTASTREMEDAFNKAEGQIYSNIDAHKRVIESMERNNKTAKELDDVIRAQRESFIDQQIAMGKSKEEAEALADTYNLIPNKVETKAILDKERAQTDAEIFRAAISKPVTISLRLGPMPKTPQTTFQQSIRPGPMADGGIRSRAWGALDEPQIQPGRGAGLFQVSPLGPVNWAEGETQGEAFIPFAPSKRKRAIDIWEETGKRLGQFPVRSFANGSFDGQSSRPLAPSVVSNSLQGRMLSDADVRAIADAVREGAAGGVREGMDGAGGGISTLVRAGHGQ